MTDYSDAAANAADAIANSADGLIEEYEIRANGRRVKRGKAKDQLDAALLLEGLAARRSRGIFTLGKPKNPR